MLSARITVNALFKHYIQSVYLISMQDTHTQLIHAQYVKLIEKVKTFCVRLKESVRGMGYKIWAIILITFEVCVCNALNMCIHIQH